MLSDALRLSKGKGCVCWQSSINVLAQRMLTRRSLAQMEEKARKAALKTHKDRVAEFNDKLQGMSEHYDIPKCVDAAGFFVHLALTRRLSLQGRPWIKNACDVSFRTWQDIYVPLSLSRVPGLSPCVALRQLSPWRDLACRLFPISLVMFDLH